MILFSNAAIAAKAAEQALFPQLPSQQSRCFAVPELLPAPNSALPRLPRRRRPLGRQIQKAHALFPQEPFLGPSPPTVGAAKESGGCGFQGKRRCRSWSRRLLLSGGSGYHAIGGKWEKDPRGRSGPAFFCPAGNRVRGEVEGERLFGPRIGNIGRAVEGEGRLALRHNWRTWPRGMEAWLLIAGWRSAAEKHCVAGRAHCSLPMNCPVGSCPWASEKWVQQRFLGLAYVPELMPGFSWEIVLCNNVHWGESIFFRVVGFLSGRKYLHLESRWSSVGYTARLQKFKC